MQCAVFQSYKRNRKKIPEEKVYALFTNLHENERILSSHDYRLQSKTINKANTNQIFGYFVKKI